jgi:hypothetical protein
MRLIHQTDMEDEKPKDLILSFKCPSCGAQHWLIDSYYWEATCLVCKDRFHLKVNRGHAMYKNFIEVAAGLSPKPGWSIKDEK